MSATGNNTSKPGTPTSTNSDAEFERLYQKRRAADERKAQAEVDKRVKREDAKTAKLAKSQTVRFSVLQTSGQPIHLCEDNEWRTDAEMSRIGLEEDE